MMKRLKGVTFYSIVLIIGLGGIAGIFIGLCCLTEWVFAEVTAPIAAATILAAFGLSGLFVFMLGKIAGYVEEKGLL